MSKERELLNEVLEYFDPLGLNIEHCGDLPERIKELLAQPEKTEQEPVAIDENTSDGYHTFKELYEFRKAYNVALFNEWGATGKCHTHKSWRHNDGELCFGGGWFIVVATLPQGQISNHYEAKDWDLFSIQEVEKALFEFDGHTGADVVDRLKLYTAPPVKSEQEPVVKITSIHADGENLPVAITGVVLSDAVNIWDLPIKNNDLLFLAPPKREPLSLEELCKLYGDNVVEDIFTFARAIEKAHGIGGGE
jgi:hypothetical protein